MDEWLRDFGGSCQLSQQHVGFWGGEVEKGVGLKFYEDGERDISRMPPTVREAGTIRYVRIGCPFNAREQ